MPTASSVERPHSHDIVGDLLSEAWHLVVRDRAGEEDNLLQIQQAIEAAQRELRRLRLRSSVEEFRAIAAQARLSEEVDEVEQSSEEGLEADESSYDVDGYTDDEEDGVALVTRTQNGTTVGERALGEDGVCNSLASDQEERTVDEEEGGVYLTTPDVEDANPESPSSGRSPFGLPGRSLVYTDLSRLRRERSFVDFMDRRVGRATSSNLPDPGNILEQMLRDGDTWTIRPALGAEEDWEETESEDDSSGGISYSVLSRVTTPLPTPPRFPTATVQRDNTSISSTGATTASSVALEGRQDEGGRESQSSFTKERRVQLMAAMTADMARCSQEREWAFYQGQGYCVFPSVESPVPESETHAIRASTGQPGNGEERSTGMRTLRRSRRDRNRAILPVQLFERRPVNELPDPADDFLVYLLTETQSIRGLGPRRQEEEGPPFEELRLPFETARFRYSLVRETMDPSQGEDHRIAFERSLDLLRREDSSRGTSGARLETATSMMLLAA